MRSRVSRSMRDRALMRRAPWVGLTAVVAVITVSSLGGSWYRSHHVRVPLYSTTVVLDGGERVMLDPGSPLAVTAASRVQPGTGQAEALRAEERRWLAEGAVPAGPSGQYAEASRSALLDLRVLTLDNGASVAAWSPRWRYVWPRDASFAAVALSRTGHVDDAERILLYLRDMQSPTGHFQARYLPDGSGNTPDNRGVQLDGTGWVLWALSEWYEALPPAERQQRTQVFGAMLDRSVDAMGVALDDPPHLPEVSPDYWEVPEDELTLGTAAPWLAGLQAAQRVYAGLGESARAHRVDGLQQQLSAAIVRTFGPRYARYADGKDRDAAVAFLLPPFVHGFEDLATDPWRAAAAGMARPAGGLAPGEGWKNDGISWTPQTSLFAFTAATTGDTVRATAWLDWLVAHRTAAGSFPEKVLSDGQPAGPAPLAWTSALFLLGVQALDAHEGS